MNKKMLLIGACFILFPFVLADISYPLNITGGLEDTNAGNTVFAPIHMVGCTDNNQLSLIYYPGGTELNIDPYVGTCGGDQNIAFKLQNTISAGATLNSTTSAGYFITVKSSIGPATFRDKNQVYVMQDGFETGSPIAAWQNTDGNWVDSISVSHSGNHSQKLNSAPSEKRLPISTAMANHFGVFIRWGDTSDNPLFGILKSPSGYSSVIRQHPEFTDNIEWYTSGSYQQFSPRIVGDVNKWYWFVVEFNGGGDHNVSVYNESFSLLGKIQGPSAIANPDMLGVRLNGASNEYVDDVAVWSAPKFPPIFSVGGSNLVPDVNLNYPNSAGLSLTGTHNIDINFADFDLNVNARYDGNIALKDITAGSSSIIYSDANLFVYCTNMDSNATTKQCLFPYDFSSLTASHNYKIDLNFSDGTNTVNEIGTYTFSLYQAPGIDFTIYKVDSNVVVDPNIVGISSITTIKWSFDVDGNINYFGDINRDYNYFDTFESGNLDNWQLDGCGASTGIRITNNPDLVYSGTYAATEDYTTAERCMITKPTWFSYQPDKNYGTFARVGNGNDGVFLELINPGEIGATSVTKISNGNFYCSKAPYAGPEPTWEQYAVGAVIGHWYELIINFHPDTNTQDCYAYDVNGDLKGAAIGLTTWVNAVPTQARMNTSARVTGGFDNFNNGRYLTGGYLTTETDLNQSHRFNFDGPKTICLTVGNSDGNNTVCKIYGTYDLNILTPNGNNYLSIANAKSDGNQSIDFNLISFVSGTPRARIYLSSLPNHFENLLFDLNLGHIALNPTSDYNCGLSSPDFNVLRQCHADWNIMANYHGDGNWFVDINLSYYGQDGNSIKSSSNSFVIDTNRPSVQWDGNDSVWQRADSNIHLICIDSYCDSTKLFYRMDSDRNSSSTMGQNIVFNGNILFAVSAGDGNFRLDFNTTDLAGNTSDLNTHFVLLDNTAPTLSNITPSGPINSSNSIFNFVFSIGDGNGSYAQTCDYNGYANDAIIAAQKNKSGIISSDKKSCLANFSYGASIGDKIDINAKVTDYAGLSSAIVKSFSYIFNSGIDFNLGAPNGNNYLSFANSNYDGNHSIDFNISATSSNYLEIKIYKSQNSLTFQNLLFDYNLSRIAVNPIADLNCGASSIDFSTKRLCHLDWNAAGLNYTGDGNYYLDFNIVDYPTQVSSQYSSATAFMIDTNKPLASWDGNDSVWQRTDSNIHLTCADSGGCDLSKLFYRVDSNPLSSSSMGTNVLFDKNVLLRIATGDGNYEVDFNATDLAGNTSELNSRFILLDNTAPSITAQIPAVDSDISSTIFPWVFILYDGNGSGAQSCDFNGYNNNSQIAGLNKASGTILADGLSCSVSFNAAITLGTFVDVNVEVFDKVGLVSTVTKSFKYTYSSSPPLPPGGGGGGGLIDTPLTITSSLVELTPSTSVIDLYKTNIKQYFITVTSKADQNIPFIIIIAPALKPYLTAEIESSVLMAHETKVAKFTAQNSNDSNFEPVLGSVNFVLNNGQVTIPVPVTIEKTDTPDTFDFLNTKIIGIPVVILLVVGVVAWFVNKRL